MHAKISSTSLTRRSASHYGSLRRLESGAARVGYLLERGEIIDTENNSQLTECAS